MVFVSNPTPPLDSDFGGGTVIFVSEDSRNTIGLSSNGNEVVIVVADSDEVVLGLVGIALSSSECEIVMSSFENGDKFEDASGECRIEENGNGIILEDVTHSGTPLGFELRGEFLEEIILTSDNLSSELLSSAKTEVLIQGFLTEIIENLKIQN